MTPRYGVWDYLGGSLRQFGRAWRTALELALFYGVFTAIMTWALIGTEAAAGQVSPADLMGVVFWVKGGLYLILTALAQILVFFIFARRLLHNAGWTIGQWRVSIRVFVLRYLQVLGLLILAALVVAFFVTIFGAGVSSATGDIGTILMTILLIAVVIALLTFISVAGPMLVGAAIGDDRTIEACWRRQQGQRPRIVWSLFLLSFTAVLVGGLLSGVLGLTDFRPGMPWPSMLLKAIASQTLGQLVTLLNISFFALVYMRVIGDQDPMTES